MHQVNIMNDDNGGIDFKVPSFRNGNQVPLLPEIQGSVCATRIPRNNILQYGNVTANGCTRKKTSMTTAVSLVLEYPINLPVRISPSSSKMRRRGTGRHGRSKLTPIKIRSFIITVFAFELFVWGRAIFLLLLNYFSVFVTFCGMRR